MQTKVELCTDHTTQHIKGFFGLYRWLSNFHLCNVVYDGDTYVSTENAYQAAKFAKEHREAFFACTPNFSKTLGNNREMAYTKHQWDTRKLDVMYDCLLFKFNSNPYLRQLLIDTRDRHLEETNWWDDTFWGVCNGVGMNHLGKILMEIRSGL